LYRIVSYRICIFKSRTVNKWAWHAVQFRRTFWSEQSQSDRTDLVWS